MRRHLFASDLVILGYLAAITVLVLACWGRIGRPWIFLAYHAAVVAMIGLIVFAWARYGGRFWRFVRYWCVVIVVLAAYREVFYLAPQVHPFDGLPWDRHLDRIDTAVFGDVGEWLRTVLWRPLVDLLTACYWTYYPLAAVVGGVLWKRSRFREIRAMLTVLLLCWFVSFLGYYAVPARGPHIYEREILHRPRDAAWDGVLLARPLHDFMIDMEWSMPDAFPSGHTLLALVLVLFAWRHRTVPAVISFCGAGIVLATIYLRYHYVTDVLASIALLPFCWFGGRALFRFWERPEDPRR